MKVFHTVIYKWCRSQWQRDLRRVFVAGITGSIPAGNVDVCLV